MALTADLTKTGVSVDGTTTTWTDETVYGGANPDRNEVAVFITAYKVNEALEETALTVASFDPESATSFTITNTSDGWQKTYFVIADTWLVGTTYNRDDVVWSASLNQFYEYINATPSAGNIVTNTTYWAVLADPTTKIADVGTAEESGNLIYQVVSTILDYQVAKCYGNVMVRYAIEICGEYFGCDSELEKTKKRLHTLLTVMRLDNTRQLYLEGERATVLATTYCEDCGC